MSLGTDADDLLPPLDDFIDSDTDIQLNELGEETDDFDAIALLSQPIFGDCEDDLEIEKGGSEEFDFVDSLPSTTTSTNNNNNTTTITSGIGQSNFQQQQPSQGSYAEGRAGHSANMSPMHQQHVTFQGSGHDGSRISSPFGGETDISSLPRELQNVNYQVQDVQRSILQVQQQIEQVKLGASYTSPQHKQSASVQDQIDIQNLMNQAGMNRSPPGRSISMPIRRNQTPGRPLTQPTFMMQKPMDQLMEQTAMMENSQQNSGSSRTGMNMVQFQQQQQQQAMMGNSQGSAGSHGTTGTNPNAPGGALSINQLQMMMHENSIDGVINSPVSGGLGMMQQSLMDRQRGVPSSPDGSQFSHHSQARGMSQGMNPMQGNMMQGINQPFSLDDSDRSAMSNMRMVANMQGANQGYSVDNMEANVMNNMSMMNNMSNMQGFNQGFNLGGSERHMMHNLQGFNNLDSSARSMPGDMSGMGMNPNMMMMMQQQQHQMMNFADRDAAQRQNSLASSNHSQEMMVAGADFELANMQRSFQAQGLISGSVGQQMSLGQAPTSGLSMERLVEKMQRSALSRNLVKQMSGTSVPVSNTGRSLSRSHSGRGVSRTNSKAGRSLSRANSGRSVQRTLSGRLPEGGELPVRRLAQDPKHRIKEPGASNSVHRGVVRHKSQSAAMGSTIAKVVNIDGKEVGWF